MSIGPNSLLHSHKAPSFILSSAFSFRPGSSKYCEFPYCQILISRVFFMRGFEMLFRITLLILGLAAGTIYALKGQFFLKLDLLASAAICERGVNGRRLARYRSHRAAGRCIIELLGASSCNGHGIYHHFFSFLPSLSQPQVHWVLSSTILLITHSEWHWTTLD